MNYHTDQTAFYTLKEIFFMDLFNILGVSKGIQFYVNKAIYLFLD